MPVCGFKSKHTFSAHLSSEFNKLLHPESSVSRSGTLPNSGFDDAAEECVISVKEVGLTTTGTTVRVEGVEGGVAQYRASIL